MTAPLIRDGLIDALRRDGRHLAADNAERINREGAALIAAATALIQAERDEAEAAHGAALADPERSMAVHGDRGTRRRCVVRHTVASVWLARDAGDTTGERFLLRSGNRHGRSASFHEPFLDWSQPAPRALVEAAAKSGSVTARRALRVADAP